MTTSDDAASPPYELGGNYPRTCRSGRKSIAARLWRLLTSPSAALLLLYPTIGYYTLATYSDFLFAEDDSTGGILIRGGSLAVLLIAYLRIPSSNRRVINPYLLPATVFVLIYCCRLFDNMVLLGFDIPPGNTLILALFLLSGLLAAYLLAASAREIRDEAMIRLLSLFAVLFLIGMALNWDALAETADHRLFLNKINPIAVAYTAASFLLFYMLAFTRSPRLLIETAFVVPCLLILISLARSRGMLISTSLTILVYMLLVRGRQKIWALLALATIAIAIVVSGSGYVGYAIEALQRIDMQADQSTLERVIAFRGAWEQFLADPLTGRYINEQTFDFYPHNIYLESLMAVGIVGTIPFMLHVMLALRAAFGLLRRRRASFVSVFVALLFVRDSIGAAASGALWGSAEFWISSFLVIAMWYGPQRNLSYNKQVLPPA